MEKITWSYIAGLFDGEGGIRLARKQQKDRNGVRLFQISLYVSNTNKTVIDFLKNNLGGFIYQSNYSPTTRKAVYHWELSGLERVRDFLLNIRDFSIIKKPQLELTLSLIHERLQHIGGSIKERHLTEKEILLLNDIKTLNTHQKTYIAPTCIVNK